MIDPRRYTRKPFDVKAERVTEQNMQDVSEWCEGDIRTSDDGKRYIQIPAFNPRNERHTRAFRGDWVVWSDDGFFKVYLNTSFTKAFAPAAIEEVEKAVESKPRPPRPQRKPNRKPPHHNNVNPVEQGGNPKHKGSPPQKKPAKNHHSPVKDRIHPDTKSMITDFAESLLKMVNGDTRQGDSKKP